jgi:hypothetical protein
MPVLRLENVPDELIRRLEQIARRRQDTPAAAALSLLQEALAREDGAEEARVRAMLDQVRKTRYPLAPGTPDSVDLLREDRGR